MLETMMTMTPSEVLAVATLSGGVVAPMLLDGRQREEIFLTSTQSLFALVVIANFRFSYLEALLLVGLFIPQLFLTAGPARWLHALLYLALAVGAIVLSPSTRHGVRQILPWPGRRAP